MLETGMHLRMVMLGFLIASISLYTAAAQIVKDYPDQPKLSKLVLGDQPPDFKLPGIDGKDHSLSEYSKAEILAILFTCNHCPTSRAFEQMVIDMVKKYSDRSFQLVAISPNDPGAVRPDEVASSDLGDSFEEMKIRAADMKYNFPYLYDGDTQKAAMSYGAVVTPQIFIFDKDRKLRYTGAIEDDRGGGGASDAIDAILSGSEISVPMTHPYGCSTKWGFKRMFVDEQNDTWDKKPVDLNEITSDELVSLKKNDSWMLRLICVWSLEDKSCQDQFDKLIYLRRIYEFRPLELITVNCDPINRKEQVLEFLKKNRAALADPSPEIPNRPPANFIYSGEITGLWKALDLNHTASSPVSLIIAPENRILLQQDKKLDVMAIRKKLAQLLSQR